MMEIDEDEILRNVANGGSIDYSVWPALLPRIVSRIEKIAHDEFPIPRLPPAMIILPSSIPQPATQADSDTAENFMTPLPSSPIEPSSSASSQDTNKENTPNAPRTTAPPTSAPASTAAPLPAGTLPGQIVSMLTEIISTLKSTFPTYPPHTVQRLSELVLNPTHHYRSLATYLHALDRVVHVTSGLNIYPLPPTVSDISAGGLLPNGTCDGVPMSSQWAAPGSDEALGGALLTPIPWLQHNHQGMGGSPQTQAQPAIATPDTSGQSGDLEGEVRTESTETIDGPNGVGSIETVSVSVNGIPSMGARGVGVTQGELLRQEQRAGVVPVSQLVPSHHVHSGHVQALQQQHIQARLHLQHHQARSSSATTSSPDSSTSATPPSSSTPSSATLEEEERDEGPSPVEIAAAAAAAAQDPANAPMASVRTTNAEDEEKPHARGPEEIGPDDLGPQSASNTSTIGGPGGVEMQGIDIQAAVGRKAVDSPSTRSSPPEVAASKKEQTLPGEDDSKEGGKNEGGEKMDVEMGDRTDRSPTPKREAEGDVLEGSAASKRLKEDGADMDTGGTKTEGKAETTDGGEEKEGEKREGQEQDKMDEGKEKDEDAMDKD
ncbi:hypothetical protein F5X96DRAFT_633498 [Biscogniauxia mediterranea]|nr:hypothetical protein F5X96DRAFT_633498 [Biscogniauxia mediterranea]